MTMMDGSNGKPSYLVLAKINAIKGHFQFYLCKLGFVFVICGGDHEGVT